MGHQATQSKIYQKIQTRKKSKLVCRQKEEFTSRWAKKAVTVGFAGGAPQPTLQQAKQSQSSILPLSREFPELSWLSWSSFPWDRSRYQLLVETTTEIAKSFQMSPTVLLPHPLMEQRKDYRLSPHLCRSIHPSPRPCRPFLQIPLQVFHHILSLSKNWAPYRDSQKEEIDTGVFAVMMIMKILNG